MGRDIISLDDLTSNNIGVFKKINQSVLPKQFPDLWYKDSLDSSLIVKLAYYAELPVGAIKGRPINTKESFNLAVLPSNIIPDAIYIDSLAVLENYQNLTIGKKLLAHLVEETKKKFIHLIILHVQEGNEHALKWYEAQGFVKGELVKNYYKDLEDKNAWALKLEV